MKIENREIANSVSEWLDYCHNTSFIASHATLAPEEQQLVAEVFAHLQNSLNRDTGQPSAWDLYVKELKVKNRFLRASGMSLLGALAILLVLVNLRYIQSLPVLGGFDVVLLLAVGWLSCWLLFPVLYVAWDTYQEKCS